MRSFSTERFMLWINHFGSSVKGEFGEGNFRGVQIKMVAVGLEMSGLM